MKEQDKNYYYLTDEEQKKIDFNKIPEIDLSNIPPVNCDEFTTIETKKPTIKK